jgi:Leucine-rich repeat (LRR) protein
MADMTDGESIAEERIAEAARTGQDWLDLAGLGLSRLPDRLADLTNLRRLSIGKIYRVSADRTRARYAFNHRPNVFSNFSPLVSLTNLLELYIDGTHCEDLRPLMGLKRLQHLNCSFTLVDKLSGLEELSHLKRLDCGDTQVQDLKPLMGLKYLQHLNFSNTDVENLTPLVLSKALRILDCGSTPIYSLKPLSNLTNLINLDCSGTRIEELSPLTGLKKLSYLNCGLTAIKDLSPIGELYKLKRLHCDGTLVSDLSPVTELRNLTHITAEKCKIWSLPPEIGQLHQLVLLDLEGNALRNLPKALGYLHNLETAFVFQRPRYPLVGLLLEGNPLEDPLPGLIAPGQPQATINVLRWLRGEPIEAEAKEPDPPTPVEDADDPPAIPEQGAGPRVILDPTGRLVFARPSDLDAKGNDRNRLEALHPALREAAADLAKALQDHPSNLPNERLLQKVEAYRALVDVPLEEVDFARLYAAGMQLLNAAGATRRALEAGRADMPDLTPIQDECLANIENLHPPFVLASRDGQEMLADQTTIKLTAESVEGVKEAGTELGQELINHPDLADREVGETIRDAAAEIRQGENDARDAVITASTMRNAVIVLATASKWAAIPTAVGYMAGGLAVAGTAAGATLWWFGTKVAEKTKVFQTDVERVQKALSTEANNLSVIRNRIEGHQSLLLKVEPKLRKMTQLPGFTWLGPSLDWLKRNSPPDKKE